MAGKIRRLWNNTIGKIERFRIGEPVKPGKQTPKRPISDKQRSNRPANPNWVAYKKKQKQWEDMVKR